MQAPAPSTTSPLLDATFLATTVVQILGVYFGVYFAQRFADRAAARDRDKENEENREFVRGAVSTSIAQALIAVWAHRRDLAAAGAPNSVGIPSWMDRVDPFRVTQALGREGYDAFVTIAGLVDLTNAYFARLSSEHALSFYSVKPAPEDPREFARRFYAPSVEQMIRMLAQVETQITNYLAVLDPARLQQLKQESEPKLLGRRSPTQSA